MKAMVLEQPGQPLHPVEVPKPQAGPGQVLIQVHTCGVCRTDLHIMDGELTHPKLPLIPGHQIVGTVVGKGSRTEDIEIGDRVGVPWLGWTCGHCEYCLRGQENLCDEAKFTGYDIDGGFAEYCVADARYCFPVPDDYHDENAAPLLCAGLIGYRALRMAGNAERLGFYGFGSSAHLLTQLALHQNRAVYAFTRPGDRETQEFATNLGAYWAGGSDERPPEPLDAAIIFAPVGALVPQALRAVRKGGTVVCAGIHMSDIPSFPYGILWEERKLVSVANLTRRDGIELLRGAPQVPIRAQVRTFELGEANEALNALREGRIEGSAVLRIKRDDIRADRTPMS